MWNMLDATSCALCVGSSSALTVLAGSGIRVTGSRSSCSCTSCCFLPP
eukprot:CAMPEP_0196756290 /NCGR_PEP_ID=MMETSP1091-20130531/100485_1 /TAXON_ID=302021 /ORGANISM="Rhodomonas sp., Strain CCMP768" /LENGTH=47 /DNA_ID= /DNA_START= /DNA_END= /DNA_ORIENTATION=